MVERGRKANYTLSQPDLFIPAIAAVHGLCVVTRNVDEFIPAEVPVLNPWTGRLIRLGGRFASIDEAGSKGAS